ncbi:psbP domain-containing protein 4, chloroplastic-like isoform X1 [Chenopodium quinoa]|uniref:psbP domain-containing protein 4, chloroplastic-like isoform X1 n=1 Tax=Chenopodium quinoa TaxID=63459 RepID=UPI000B78F66C|nr:psbP domain-containing protein 4, chloroplastic-like isoform X1 [Chenopodium quinoa]
MISTMCSSSSCLAWDIYLPKHNRNQNRRIRNEFVQSSFNPAETSDNDRADQERLSSGVLKRRSLVLQSGVAPLVTSLTALGFPAPGSAVVKQGPLAGRVPGLSEPNEEGWRTYQRPDEKSGGHGVGWSPIIPYLFKVPGDWDEVPVSIADLGGTEIDLRFASPKQGRLFVVVAPVRRFADELGDNTTIEEIGTPEKVISAFGPEVIGENVEGRVLSTNVAEHSGRRYYQFELEPPHIFITATAAGNRLYLFCVTGSGREQLYILIPYSVFFKEQLHILTPYVSANLQVSNGRGITRI